MLYSRWQETLSRFRDRAAIMDEGGITTFGALDAALAAMPRANGPILARGAVASVALATLRGWRDGQPVVPLDREAPAPLLPPSRPEGVAHIKFTPGIEGSPRAVFFTAEQIAADGDRLVEAMGLSGGMTTLAAASVTQSYGFSNIILPLLLHGVPVHPVEVPFPRVVASALSQHSAVAIPAVPSMWRAWHRSGILGSPSIALAITAGAPLTLELEHLVYGAAGLKLHNFYGATECGGISWDAGSTPRSDAAGLGTPLPGVDVSVSTAGRFQVRSSSVALGYQTLREGEILGDGTFLTHDWGRMEDGCLMLESSGSESVNVAGRKIGPARVEAALLATGMLARVRIFGVPSPDPERVEEITALVQLLPGAELEQLRSAATAQLAGWEMPRHWAEADDDSLWKLGRRDLRQWFPGR